MDSKPENETITSRKIIEENGQRFLVVSSLDDLKVISSPQRLRIFKLLRSAGRPLHGKYIADNIGIKAPSVHFHLRKLEGIGAVRISHTQNVNGITAVYYEPAVDGMLAGEDFLTSVDDEQISDKLLLAANFYNEAKASFLKTLGGKLSEGGGAAESFTVLLNMILYLSPEETGLFNEEMTALIKKYSDFSPEKQPFSMFLSVSEMTKA